LPKISISDKLSPIYLGCGSCEVKRKTTEVLQRELALGRSRFNRRVARKNRNYSYGQKKQPVNALFNGKVIVAPEIISIYEFSSDEANNYSETIRFSERLESEMAKGPCVVDFRNTQRVSAAALVVVYAAIDSCSKRRLWKSTILWSSISPSVNQALKRSRLADKIKGKEFDYAFSGLKHLPIVSSFGSRNMEDILDYIQERIYENKMSPETEYIYGDAVSETINNVGLHAYPGLASEEKKWWLLCSVIGDQLYLAIYDRGIGIPKTVLEKPWFLTSMEKVYPEQYQEIRREVPELERMGLKVFVPKKLKDSELIYLSMLGDVTGTKKDKHGQGSKSIKALVDETEDGILWIFSNRGLYNFSKDEDGPDLYKLPMKMSGTLIQWNIKL
jgi:anti-anti-sigma regulatory factor